MKGFIQFSMDYYRNKVENYEKEHISKEELYEAKQLLKAVDDVLDEGYTKLHNALEEENLVSRLRVVLEKNGETPFSMPQRIGNIGDYGEEEFELSSYLDQICLDAKSQASTAQNPFIGDLLAFCDWIGYDEDTAYVFLLRDTLIPYLHYKEKGYKNLYPWLIGRKFLEDLADEPGLDDDFRYPIFNAADEKITDYEEFVKYCRADIMDSLKDYSKVEYELKKLLASIKQDQIVVIESGCYGTFPMLLASLDERVTIKMFTAVPFLWEQYQDHIFTKEYEKNREFETLYSQDILLKYSSYRDCRFFVKVNESKAVWNQAMSEIKAVCKGD